MYTTGVLSPLAKTQRIDLDWAVAAGAGSYLQEM
jgi:hypothetical protein